VLTVIVLLAAYCFHTQKKLKIKVQYESIENLSLMWGGDKLNTMEEEPVKYAEPNVCNLIACMWEGN
jgi:hypothetical protein